MSEKSQILTEEDSWGERGVWNFARAEIFLSSLASPASEIR